MRAPTKKAARSTVPSRDSWIAAEVTGDKSLWPVVIPYEIPTLLLTDAVGTVGAAVGLPDEFGNLKPRQQTQTLPWALSNPLLIDGDLDGKWGSPIQRGPVLRARLDGSGDDTQLLDLRRSFGDTILKSDKGRNVSPF